MVQRDNRHTSSAEMILGGKHVQGDHKDGHDEVSGEILKNEEGE